MPDATPAPPVHGWAPPREAVARLDNIIDRLMRHVEHVERDPMIHADLRRLAIVSRYSLCLPCSGPAAVAILLPPDECGKLE